MRVMVKRKMRIPRKPIHDPGRNTKTSVCMSSIYKMDYEGKYIPIRWVDSQ